jgi:hypothetical protein
VHRQYAFGPIEPEVVGVQAGGVPLPRGVEVVELRYVAQIAAAAGQATGVAVPEVVPVHLNIDRKVVRRDLLVKPERLLAGVYAKELHRIAAD